MNDDKCRCCGLPDSAWDDLESYKKLLEQQVETNISASGHRALEQAMNRRARETCEICGDAGYTIDPEAPTPVDCICVSPVAQESKPYTVGPCIRCGYVGEDDAAFDHHNCAPSVSAQDVVTRDMLDKSCTAYTKACGEAAWEDGLRAALTAALPAIRLRLAKEYVLNKHKVALAALAASVSSASEEKSK